MLDGHKCDFGRRARSGAALHPVEHGDFSDPALPRVCLRRPRSRTAPPARSATATSRTRPSWRRSSASRGLRGGTALPRPLPGDRARNARTARERLEAQRCRGAHGAPLRVRQRRAEARPRRGPSERVHRTRADRGRWFSDRLRRPAAPSRTPSDVEGRPGHRWTFAATANAKIGSAGDPAGDPVVDDHRTGKAADARTTFREAADGWFDTEHHGVAILGPAPTAATAGGEAILSEVRVKLSRAPDDDLGLARTPTRRRAGNMLRATIEDIVA